MKKSIQPWPELKLRRIEIAPAAQGSSQMHFESGQTGRVAPGAGSVLETARADARSIKGADYGATLSPPAATTEQGKIQSSLTLTVGDLILELTDSARRFVHDEEELYEVVAHLLETRLKRRRRTDYFLQTVHGHVRTGGFHAAHGRRRVLFDRD